MTEAEFMDAEDFAPMRCEKSACGYCPDDETCCKHEIRLMEWVHDELFKQ